MAKLFIFSGAGLSAESGVSTFRTGPDGIWENHDLDKVCNYRTWKQNYDLVHQFYNQRRVQLGAVEPNAAHRQIAEWQSRYDTVVLTQNIDDLLERAGCKDVIHLHGFLPEMVCEACGHVWNIGYGEWEETHRCERMGRKVACHSRKGVKPNVVFFNQSAPQYADLYATINGLTPDDVVLVVGTSEAVIPIGHYLRQAQGFKIFNALEPSIYESYDETLIEPATEAFPKIDRILQHLFL